MAKDQGKNIAIGALVVLALYLVWSGGTLGATPATGEPSKPQTGGVICSFAPTAQLQAKDKWNSLINPNGNQAFKYMLNGGKSQTDTDGSFEVTFGDDLTVLWADGNTSYVQDIGTYTIDKCGLNIISSDSGLESGLDGLVKNGTLTVQCFNEEGNLIVGTAGAEENETIGAGESVTLSCEIKGASEAGIPHGGVLVVELSKTHFDEEKTEVTGSVIKGSTSMPEYTISNTSYTAFAWDVNQIIHTGTRNFDLFMKADDTNAPTYGTDPVVTLISKIAFENSETSKFEIAVDNEDSARVGAVVGGVTVQVD